MQNKTAPNRCLWMLKGISCLLVIAFHTQVSHPVSKAATFALRFPLPIFFMISGYFSFRKENMLEYVKKAAVLILWGELFAGIVTQGLYWAGRGSRSALQILGGVELGRVVLFGSVFNGSLWYLYSMIWAWLLFCFLKKKGLFPYAYALMLPLMAVPILVKLVCGWYLELPGFTLWASDHDYLFRCVPVFGGPFMLLGRWIAEHRERILSRITVWTALGILLAGLLLDGAEYAFIHYFMDLQVSTVVISLGLFLFALVRPEFAPARGLTYVGKELSTMVYILHIPLVRILQEVLTVWAPRLLDTLAYPALAMAAAIAASLTVKGIGRLLHEK